MWGTRASRPPSMHKPSTDADFKSCVIGNLLPWLIAFMLSGTHKTSYSSFIASCNHWSFFYSLSVVSCKRLSVWPLTLVWSWTEIISHMQKLSGSASEFASGYFRRNFTFEDIGKITSRSLSHLKVISSYFLIRAVATPVSQLGLCISPVFVRTWVLS